MRAFTVKYYLDTEEIERLEAIAQAYREKGFDQATAENIFSGLMLMGSKKDIKEKLDFAEINSAGIGKRVDNENTGTT